MIANCGKQLWLVNAGQELSRALGSRMDVPVLENKSWKVGRTQAQPRQTSHSTVSLESCLAPSLLPC